MGPGPELHRADLHRPQARPELHLLLRRLEQDHPLRAGALPHHPRVQHIHHFQDQEVFEVKKIVTVILCIRMEIQLVCIGSRKF